MPFEITICWKRAYICIGWNEHFYSEILNKQNEVVTTTAKFGKEGLKLVKREHLIGFE
jgi:hypothetical protein